MAKPQRKRGPRIQEKDARFAARLTPEEASLFDAISDRRGIAKSAVLRAWIHGSSLPSADDQERRLLLFIANKLEVLGRILQQRPTTSSDDVRLMNRLVLFAARMPNKPPTSSKSEPRVE